MKTKKNKKYINVTKKYIKKNKIKNKKKYIKKNNNKNIKTRKKGIKKYIKSRKKKYIEGSYKIIENVCYNFSEQHNCRWCGSLEHHTTSCCLNI